MIKYLSNGGLSKTFSILYQFIIGVGCAYIVGVEILHGEPVNPLLAGIISGILGHQITVYAGSIVSDTSNKQTELTAAIANPNNAEKAKEVLHGTTV